MGGLCDSRCRWDRGKTNSVSGCKMSSKNFCRSLRRSCCRSRAARGFGSMSAPAAPAPSGSLGALPTGGGGGVGASSAGRVGLCLPGSLGTGGPGSRERGRGGRRKWGRGGHSGLAAEDSSSERRDPYLRGGRKVPARIPPCSARARLRAPRSTCGTPAPRTATAGTCAGSGPRTLDALRLQSSAHATTTRTRQLPASPHLDHPGRGYAHTSPEGAGWGSESRLPPRESSALPRSTPGPLDYLSWPKDHTEPPPYGSAEWASQGWRG